MKRLLIFCVLVLSAVFVNAGEDSQRECLKSFTVDYFQWFRGELSSQGSDLMESLSLERNGLKALLTLLKNTEQKSCPSQSQLMFSNLRGETQVRLKQVEHLMRDLKSGAEFEMSEEFVKSKSAYKKYNAGVIKNLMYETGIKW